MYIRVVEGFHAATNCLILNQKDQLTERIGGLG
ncbi:hypothetical protein BkAM31D_08450 [Halalkalibacter krulwichiae]|uniref:Uncharacterized protein n=1 Tax=Halalkalibacter krulwichiae TaxID=199441 RepID=A0A1X9MBC5_9BACI|nr:hypothetical protein BkAM31D_08450 [Halalkalibacter krulwichiae]